MKLAVLGGGGVRSVFLARSLLNKAESLNIEQIVLMDNNVRKLEVFGGLAKAVAAASCPRVGVALTADPVEALKDADYVITTLRVGGDEARVLDERIALRHGVLGQETTGAGGFAMAMRSVPVLVEYMKLVEKYARPGAAVFNFTNPSGIITQALRDEGFANVYGICDAPSSFIKQLAALLNADGRELSVECFGLNHLSWFRSVKLNGVEKLDELMTDPRLYTETDERIFEPSAVRLQGMLLNEYLYFYYYKEKAVGNILQSGRTRGENILEINRDMIRELSKVDFEKDLNRALEIYLTYHDQRNRSYMSVESRGENKSDRSVVTEFAASQADDGGYAGVALNYIEAVVSGKPVEMVLSVPNSGAVKGLDDRDVVEITCRIDKDGATPVPVGEIPEVQLQLIKQVKLYEKLAVEAIKSKCTDTAIKALMVHPLVNSYSLARNIVQEYVKAHAEYVGHWRSL